MADSEKKLSEIVLEMAHEIGLIHKYIKNIDLTNKLILKEIRESKQSDSAIKLQLEQNNLSVPSVIAPDTAPTKITQNGKKLDVSQKVSYATNGKNVSLAPVEIFDSTNNLVKRTRTNTSGRWAAQLLPGKYRVHISKIGSKNKVLADKQFILSIDESTLPIDDISI